MPKLIASLTFILALFILFTSIAAAASLAVTKIGALDTTTFYNEWWYTSENPALSGTAGASASVSVDVDGTATSATADANGNWSHTPTTLTTGDHTITITSGAETVTFTIHIGSNVPADAGSTTTATPSATELPAAGTFTTTLGLLAFGVLLITAGTKLALKSS